MVAPANAIVDALTPSTWSAEIEASAGRAKSWATNQFAGPPSGRMAIRLLTSRVIGDEHPSGNPLLDGERGQRRTSLGE